VAPITAAQVKALYESNPDTNPFGDADKSKLESVATGATANQTDAYLRNRANHTGTQPISSVADLSTQLAGKAASDDARLTNARDWTATEVPQLEAETGEATTARKWTSLRVRQAILGWWNSITSAWGRGFVSSADAAAGRTALGLGNLATRNAAACQLWGSVDIAVPHNTLTAMTFNQEVFDASAMADIAVDNGLITVQASGVYVITISADLQGVASPNRIANLRVTRAGNPVLLVASPFDPGGAANQMSGAGTAYLNAGEQIRASIYQTTGVSINSRGFVWSNRLTISRVA